jgi:hypothetical protein
VRGTVALERGPEVFCLESVDFPGDAEEFSRVEIDLSVDPVQTEDGLTVALRTRSVDTPTVVGSMSSVTLVRYHSWVERGPSTVRVSRG